MSAAPEKATPAGVTEDTTKLGRFIQTYHGFLSSFVIGAAGLIATSIWQYKQSEIAARQAQAQQQVAQTQAENSWKIERAEILSKNLQTLSQQGSSNVEQRYGVLLSLTRGNILDPELAVSYALELGKDNPDYMRSVLVNTVGKDYWRLVHAFALTCDQRYGLAKAVPACKDDKLAGRSAALAGLFMDELQNANANSAATGPMHLLHDEHQVQSQMSRLAWLFRPALQDLYDRRQWDQIKQFEAYSTGAHLVSALVLAGSRTGELVAEHEAEELEKFHSAHRKWLIGYLLSAACDGDCRAKLVDFMITDFAGAEGDYDEAMRDVLLKEHAEAGPSLARLHTRLLWCQASEDDVVALRDHMLLPTVAAAAPGAKPKKALVERDALGDLLDLLALAPEPPASQPAALATWRSTLATVEHTTPQIYQRKFVARRAAAARERQNPPASARSANFCNAAQLTEEPLADQDE